LRTKWWSFFDPISIDSYLQLYGYEADDVGSPENWYLAACGRSRWAKESIPMRPTAKELERWKERYFDVPAILSEPLCSWEVRRDLRALDLQTPPWSPCLSLSFPEKTSVEVQVWMD